MPTLDFSTALQLGAGLVGLIAIGVLVWRARTQQRKWDVLDETHRKGCRDATQGDRLRAAQALPADPAQKQVAVNHCLADTAPTPKGRL